MNDLLGQQVHMVFLDLPVLLPQVQAGKVKPIAIGSKRRVPSLPDVPTTAEVGLPQIEAENWYGMVAPAKTPPAVIAKLHKAAVDALKSAEVHDKLAAQGAILARPRRTNSQPISRARSTSGARWSPRPASSQARTKRTGTGGATSPPRSRSGGRGVPPHSDQEPS